MKQSRSRSIKMSDNFDVNSDEDCEGISLDIVFLQMCAKYDDNSFNISFNKTETTVDIKIKSFSSETDRQIRQ